MFTLPFAMLGSNIREKEAGPSTTSSSTVMTEAHSCWEFNSITAFAIPDTSSARKIAAIFSMPDQAQLPQIKHPQPPASSPLHSLSYVGGGGGGGGGVAVGVGGLGWRWGLGDWGLGDWGGGGGWGIGAAVGVGGLGRRWGLVVWGGGGGWGIGAAVGVGGLIGGRVGGLGWQWGLGDWGGGGLEWGLGDWGGGGGWRMGILI